MVAESTKFGVFGLCWNTISRSLASRMSILSVEIGLVAIGGEMPNRQNGAQTQKERKKKESNQRNKERKKK